VSLDRGAHAGAPGADNEDVVRGFHQHWKLSHRPRFRPRDNRVNCDRLAARGRAANRAHSLRAEELDGCEVAVCLRDEIGSSRFHEGAHVNSIFLKLRLMPAPEDHRRVLAVLGFLRS
jgi:hypothetical protein